MIKFSVILYPIAGLMQTASIYGFFSEVWGWWFIFAGLASLIVAGIPVVGLIIGIYGAHVTWNWPWLSSIALFVFPTLLSLGCGFFMSLQQKKQADKVKSAA